MHIKGVFLEIGIENAIAYFYYKLYVAISI